MFKNTASQKVAVLAWDTDADAPKTGDAANITAQISKDGGATAATNDVNPTELDATDAKGIYIFDMEQAESNGDLIVLSPVSGTANIQLEPVILYTITPMRGTDSAALATGLATHDGKLDTVDALIDTLITRLSAARAGYLDNLNGHTPQTGDSFAITTNLPNAGALTDLATQALLTTVASYLDTEIAAIKTVTDNLPNSGALTTIAADAARLTAARAAVLTDWINGGRLDLLLDAASTHDAAAVKTALEADGSKLDHLWEMTEDDAGVRRLTQNALEEAPSGSGGDATAANQADMLKVLRCDVELDTGTTPWSLKFLESGTATLLYRKYLRDTDGNDVALATALVGSQKAS